MDGLVRKMGIGIGWNIDNSGLVKANNQTDGLVDNANRGSSSFKGLSNAGLVAGNTIRRAFDGAKNAISSGINRLKDMRYQLAGMATAGAGIITQSVFSAGDANETINRFNEVFKQYSDGVRQWADKYSNIIGRSKYAMYDWVSSFQTTFFSVIKDTGVQVNRAREIAAGFSKNMVQLAADLGSFHNVATSDAIERLKSGLLGNYESLEKLGISINEQTVKMFAYKNGIAETGKELSIWEKMQARMGLFLSRAGDAVDDATRTAMEFNNQWLRFRGNLDELNKDMGFSFLPTFRRGLILVNEFLETLKGSDKLKTAARILGIATAVVGLGAAIGFAAAAWGVIGGFFTLTNFAVAGVLIGLVLIIEDLWTALQGGDAVLTPVVEWFREYKNIILGVAAVITGFFAPAILSTAIPAVVRWGVSLISTAVPAIIGFIGSVWSAIAGVVAFSAALWANPITLIVAGIIALIAGLILLYKNWDKVTAWISNTWSSFVDWIGSGIDTAKGYLYGFIDIIVGWWDSIKNWFAEHFDFGGLIRSGLESAINILPGFLQDKARGFLGFDNNNTAEDEIEKEAQRTQRQIQNNNRSIKNSVSVGEIKVEAAGNPEETGKAVRKELETYFGMEAAEAGV